MFDDEATVEDEWKRSNNHICRENCVVDQKLVHREQSALFSKGARLSRQAGLQKKEEDTKLDRNPDEIDRITKMRVLPHLVAHDRHNNGGGGGWGGS